MLILVQGDNDYHTENQFMYKSYSVAIELKKKMYDRPMEYDDLYKPLNMIKILNEYLQISGSQNPSIDEFYVLVQNRRETNFGALQLFQVRSGFFFVVSVFFIICDANEKLLYFKLLPTLFTELRLY